MPSGVVFVSVIMLFPLKLVFVLKVSDFIKFIEIRDKSCKKDNIYRQIKNVD